MQTIKPFVIIRRNEHMHSVSYKKEAILIKNIIYEFKKISNYV